MSWPLSLEQQQLWRTGPTGRQVVYPLRRTYAVTGALDPAVVQAAVDRLVARHQALRLYLRNGSDGPVQECYDGPSPVPFNWVTARDEAQFHRFAAATLRADCGSLAAGPGPALRVRVLSRTPTDHVLLLAVNHMFLDGRSLNIVLDELFGGLDDPAAPPPDDEVPLFTDYVAAQAERMRSARAERSLAHWEEVYRLMPANLEIAGMTDADRSDVPTATREVAVRLADRSLRALRQALSKRGCTLFDHIAATLAESLFDRTDEDTIAFSVPFDGRSPAQRTAAGPYSMMHPVLVRRTSGDIAAQTLALRHSILLALRHREVPWEPLVAVAAAHGLGISDSDVVVNQIPSRGGRTGHQLSASGLTSRTVQDDLSVIRRQALRLKVYEAPESLDVVLEYQPARVPDRLAEDIMSEMALTLEPVAAGLLS